MRISTSEPTFTRFLTKRLPNVRLCGVQEDAEDDSYARDVDEKHDD